MFARKITNATTLTAKIAWKVGHVTRDRLPMVREHGKQWKLLEAFAITIAAERGDRPHVI